jgi:hypothetical protein
LDSLGGVEFAYEPTDDMDKKSNILSPMREGNVRQSVGEGHGTLGVNASDMCDKVKRRHTHTGVK